jgi:geranylgeranyl transferase type-1 subunit beta
MSLSVTLVNRTISSTLFFMDKEFLEKHLRLMPSHYTASDTNRMVLAYFCISGLDLLGVTVDLTSEWIYSQYQTGGFRGGPSSGDKPHLTMTYCALSMLLILNDNLSTLDSASIVNEVARLQQPNGGFFY